MNFKGFTLLEILFSIAILGIAITIITFSFSRFNSQQALDRNADLVSSILDKARALTLSSEGDSRFGVYLETSQVVLFRGDVYSPSEPANVTTTLNSLVSIRDITIIGGGASVIFNRLTGGTDQTGTLEIFLVKTPENFHTITISGTGIVELN